MSITKLWVFVNEIWARKKEILFAVNYNVSICIILIHVDMFAWVSSAIIEFVFDKRRKEKVDTRTIAVKGKDSACTQEHA